MYISICMHVRICTYACMLTQTYTWYKTYVHMYLHVCVHFIMYVCAYTYLHMYVNITINVRTLARVQWKAYMYVRTYVSRTVLMYIRSYIHIHLYVRTLSSRTQIVVGFTWSSSSPNHFITICFMQCSSSTCYAYYTALWLLSQGSSRCHEMFRWLFCVAICKL